MVPLRAPITGSWVQAGPQHCTSKRRTYPLLPSSSSVVYTHSDCVCNEVTALLGRHQAKVPPGPSPSVTTDLCAVLKPYVQHVSPWTYEQVILSYPSTRRKPLVKAHQSLLTDPVQKSDATIKMFLKDDKYTTDKPHKAPRCIQYRSKRYCLALSRHLKPIEHMCYEMLDGYGTRIIAKGRNSYQRAQDLLDKSLAFSNPTYLLLDHSNFDAHCSIPLLTVEHEFYNRCSGDPELKQLLRWQMTNRGYTKNNTNYYTPGTRMSGDMNLVWATPS